jgi:hypothetical protein
MNFFPDASNQILNSIRYPKEALMTVTPEKEASWVLYATFVPNSEFLICLKAYCGVILDVGKLSEKSKSASPSPLRFSPDIAEP